MRVIPPPGPIASGSAKGAARLARTVEKISPSSALHRQTPDGAARDARTPHPIRIELVSHGGTEAFDPNWDGPRLLPTFVAQVMGQVLNQTAPERRCAARLETAYGSAGRMALLVDRKS